MHGVSEVVLGDDSGDPVHIESDFIVEVAVENYLVVVLNFGCEVGVEAVAELSSGLLIRFIYSTCCW